MEQQLKEKDSTQSKQRVSRDRQRRFQEPRRDVDEDPGKEIWYMGF